MKNPLKVLSKKFFILLLPLCALLAVPFTGSAAEDLVFSETDIKILKTGDPDAIYDVLYKLSEIYEEKGKTALKSAVPYLIESAQKELRIPEDQRWNLMEIVKILSLTGDERVKPMLLHIMSVMWGGGNPFVARGFLAIGPSVIPAVIDSLKSKNPDTKGRAALTLHKMHDFDKTGIFFSKKDMETIKKLLVANLKDKNSSIRFYMVVALRSFGDSSAISPLEYIEKHDAHKDSGGTYKVRIEATKTLKKLRTPKKL